MVLPLGYFFQPIGEAGSEAAHTDGSREVNLFQFQMWLEFGGAFRAWVWETEGPRAKRCLGRWYLYRGHIGD